MLLSKRRFFGAVIVMFVLSVLLPSTIYKTAVSQASTCSVSVDPQVVSMNEPFNVDFEVTNVGDRTLAYLLIAKPAPQVLIESVSIDNWSVAGTEEYVELVGSTLNGGETLTFTLSASIPNGAEVNGSWGVSVSEGSSGLEPTSCSGDLSFTASVASTPPTITGISLSDLSPKSVKIHWATDEPATSQVNYGKSSAYGDVTDVQPSLVTDHSVVLTNLDPDTNYHFQLVSTDADNNTTLSASNTFLTPIAATASETVPNATSLQVKTTPTETTPPVITITTDFSRVQKTTPRISGTVTDNEVVAGVFYSTDEGKNWLPVDAMTGVNTNNATFDFTPQNLEDGNYGVVVSAIDSSSNVAKTESRTLIIDRLPPTVGASVIAIGSQILSPNESGEIGSLVGVDQKITLNATGGPVSVVIVTTLQDTKEPLQHINFTRSTENGRWSGFISYEKPGLYQLVANALDGAGNTTTRAIGSVRVSAAGLVTGADKKPIQAKISVFTRDEETNGWVLWDGEAYNQKNPIGVPDTGMYGLYMPTGTYYLKVESAGYQTVVTRSITLASAEIVNSNFSLKRKPGFDIGPVHIRLPWLVLGGSPLAERNKEKTARGPVKDVPLPEFSLKRTDGTTLKTAELYGKPTVLSFVNTWSGVTGDQFVVMDNLSSAAFNVITVNSGESVARLQAYAKRAGYKQPLVIDSDNYLISSMGASATPTTYFIDRHGVVKKAIVGVLSEEEILRYVSL